MSSKYDHIGIDYNLTRKADPFLTKRLLHHLSPVAGGLYLDIGCGTGNYTSEFQRLGYPFIGIDPSREMLDKARIQNRDVDWRMGTAEDNGLESKSVDGVIASLTLHHWTDLGLGFKELSRVLKPNSKFVIFTATPEQMEGYWLNKYFPKMLKDSIDQMPAWESIERAVHQAGMEITLTEPYDIQPDLQDQFLYCGKHNPKLYFDQQIRHGISSFSSLAHIEEVEHGLAELRNDVASGKISEVINSFENNWGDYLFILGRKP